MASTALPRDLPGATRLWNDPLIATLDDVLGAAECAHIIELARPSMRRSQVSGVAGGSVSQGRTNALTWVKHDVDPTVRSIAERIAARVGSSLDHAESLQVVHYEPGQEYRPHFDAYDLTTEKGRRYCERGGQRMVTVLAYLNDVESGGATCFPHLGLDVQPRRGRLLVWHNCHPGTNTRDVRSYHQGKPPLLGDKWAFNLWFHELPYWT